MVPAARARYPCQDLRVRMDVSDGMTYNGCTARQPHRRATLIMPLIPTPAAPRNPLHYRHFHYH